MGRNKRKAIFILFWICVWGLLAVCINNKILMAGPLDTVRALARLFGDKEFYLSVGGSLLRIATGFVLGLVAAGVLACVSFRFRWMEELLAPFISLIKTVPVASFVVILLIWWGNQFLATAICFLVAFPNIYINTLEGLKQADKQLLEMAQVFALPRATRFFYIYRNALKPFLLSSVKLSWGMCWKAGIAAELIGTPKMSVGEKMYMTKIYMDVAELFAWTFTILLMSMVLEKVIVQGLEMLCRWQPACSAPVRRIAENEPGVFLDNVCKKYEEKTVLEGVCAEYQKDSVYYLNSPSGSGKTTLLRVLAGLTEVDEGQVLVPFARAMVFQEDRLCEAYSAVKNVEMVLGDREKAEGALLKLLDFGDIHRPCGELSGGMKRRVALVRAMEADADMVLLDEPFTGMDASTRGRAEEYIAEKRQGKVLIIATHI